jgi:hypothetical protein
VSIPSVHTAGNSETTFGTTTIESGNAVAPIEVVAKVNVTEQKVKVKKFSFVKFVAVITVLVIAATAMYFIFYKSDEDRIKDRLNTFAAAYNEGDFNKLTDCFDPKTKTTLKSVAGIGSKLLGLDVEDLFGLVMGVGPSLTSKDTTIYITVHNINFTSDTTAKVDITFHFGEEKDDLTLEMMKSGGKWFGKWFIDLSNEKLF